MLTFRVHQFHLGTRHYVLLPKLNVAQQEALARRLETRGFSVRREGIMAARSGLRTIHVDPLGLCWSAADPADDVLPVIPEILSCKKEKIPLESMKRLYFTTAGAGRRAVVRLFTRMESGSSWDSLRASGECGLAPDEHAVASFLLRQAGLLRVLTDFSTDRSKPRKFGRLNYFHSILDGVQVAASLRTAGQRSPRNAYLPRDNTLEATRRLSLPRSQLSDLFDELGEWCYFDPT